MVIGGILRWVSEELTIFVVPSNVTGIEQNAFLGCKNLMEVEVPSSVTYIEHRLFTECEHLSKIVTSAGSAMEQWAEEEDSFYEAEETFKYERMLEIR